MKNRTTYTLEERLDRYGDKSYYAVPANGKEPSWLGDNLANARSRIDDLNTKYSLSDYADEEIKEFYASVSLDFLDQAVSRQLGISVKFQKAELQEGSWRTELFTTVNLARHSLLIAAAWSNFTVDTFGAAVSCDSDTGELYFWASIHYSYQHHQGGTNGAQIGTFIHKSSEGSLYTIARREGKEAAQKIIDDYLWKSFSDPLIFADRHHLAAALFESDAMHIGNPTFTFDEALCMVDALVADGRLVLASKADIGKGREDLIPDSPVYKIKR